MTTAIGIVRTLEKVMMRMMMTTMMMMMTWASLDLTSMWVRVA